MKIRSLLLGSVVAMGLSTGAAFAADPLGVLTSLDVCDSLGISGLTISSDTNCLAISGMVAFEYTIVWEEGDNSADEQSDLDWELSFDAANSTEFGPAHAIITLVEDNSAGDQEDAFGVQVDAAYVSIGDQTVIAAGLKDGIADDFTTTGFVTTKRTMFNSELEGDEFNDSSFRRTETSAIGDNDDTDFGNFSSVGALGVSVVHQFGDGFSAGVAIEDIALGTDPSPDSALVGFVSVEQEMWSGYVAAALDEITNDMDAFDVAAGVTAEFDAFSVAAAGYYASNDWNDDSYLEALFSAQAELDIVTLAVELFYEDPDADTDNVAGHLSAIGSASFGVSDTVDVAFALRYESFEESAAPGDDHQKWTVEAQVVAELTDTLDATAQGYWATDDNGADDVFGVEGSLLWNPDGDDNFVASVYAGFNNEYHTNNTFYVGTSMEKSFE